MSSASDLTMLQFKALGRHLNDLRLATMNLLSTLPGGVTEPPSAKAPQVFNWPGMQTDDRQRSTR